MKKKAFTLVEIVLVIIVLGVVAMIGTDIVAKMYEGYIRSKVINKLQTRTNQLSDLIAKRLENRIKDSAVASQGGAGGTYKKLSDSSITASYDVLEWIGIDYEGMIGNANGTTSIGWNSFIDLDSASTSKSQIHSPGSRFDYANDSIKALSYGEIDISGGGSGGKVGLIFKCNNNMDPKSYGFNGSTSSSNIYKVYIGSSNDVLKFYDTSSKEICEQYYLSWSAYAIVPEGVSGVLTDANGNTYKDFNLTLKYNYQPWEGENYSNAKSQVLAEHVSTFRFIQTGHTIRFKLCIRDPQTTYGFCKERAVF